MFVEKPNFSHDDLPLTDEQLLSRERWMMEESNWREDHSVPSSGEHYRYMWKWDSYKAIVINARRGDPTRAMTEFFALEKYRDKQTGFLSNKIFATAEHKTWRDYPEALNFNNNKIGTSYSQPPLAAWSALETYRSFEQNDDGELGLDFLRSAYGTADECNYTGLQGEHAYFINHRQNSDDDPLIGIVHPNETGRDSDEANKSWIKRRNKKLGAVCEWLHMQKLGWQIGRLGRDPEGKRIDWIPEQVRSKYWVNDVMFNVMHASNMRNLADIAEILATHEDNDEARERYHADIAKYNGLADGVESEILGQMWDSEQGYFYNLDKNGDKIPVDSITGLFPLMLKNISVEQSTALLDKLEDPDWFDTPYPIPTHAVRSKFYRPDPDGLENKLTPQWSGTVWTDMNHLLVEEGLVARAEELTSAENDQRDPELARRMLGRAGIIAAKTKELLSLNTKSMEYYSPNTGKGNRVTDFMWSLIGLHFEKYDKFKRRKV